MPTTYEVWLHGIDSNGLPVELNPEELGLSESLCADIYTWGELFMQQAPMWEWNDVRDRITFRTMSFMIAIAIQEELGILAEVHLVDRLSAPKYPPGRAG